MSPTRRALAVAAGVGIILLVLLPGGAGGQNASPAPSPTGTDGRQAGQAATAVFGTLRAPGEASLEGVVIRVEQDGDLVAETEVGSGGRWSIPLESAGTYTVAVDQETLPEGITVGEEQSSRQVTVDQGARTPVLFPLTTAGAGPAGSQFLDDLLDLVVSGIQLGAIIAITSLGLSLVFGVTGLINFAHAEMVTFGAVLALLLNTQGGPVTMHVIPAALIAIVAGAGLGYGLQQGVFGPLRRRGTGLISLLVISIGMSILLRYGILAVYGGDNNPYRNYSTQQAMSLGPVDVTPSGLVITLLSLAVLAGVGLLLTRTKLGTAIRAVADNRDLAASSGIDVEGVILAVWVSGGALAALGGILQGMSQGVTWDMGFQLLLLMFAGVILGGLGTAFGAMVGGLVVGVAIQVSTLWFSVELKRMFAFVLLIIVLLVRPTGILGQRQRVG